MSYETAPATILLATRCCVCNRPLVDAVSVELGIGPDCREKYGYNVDVEPEAREAANKLVHRVACGALSGRLSAQGLGAQAMSATTESFKVGDQIIGKAGTLRAGKRGTVTGFLNGDPRNWISIDLEAREDEARFYNPTCWELIK